jgi:hypothetical protein
MAYYKYDESMGNDSRADLLRVNRIQLYNKVNKVVYPLVYWLKIVKPRDIFHEQKLF